MALQTMIIDPAGRSYTDDEIIGKVNAAAASIDRADAIDFDALNIVQTGPGTGQFHVKKVNRHTDGTLEIIYDDVAAE
jgi:hypothetical protein